MGGTTVRVFDFAQFATNDSLDATFDDEAAGASPEFGDIIGTFTPDNPLSAFDGQSLAGDWTLTITDTNQPGDGTDLVSWSISGEANAPIPEPQTYAMFATILLGAGFMVVRNRKKDEEKQATVSA